MEIFGLPFMQRAFLAGILAATTSAFLGIFVILRRSSFFGDAIAHASLAGIAFGLLLGIDPLLTASLLAVLIAFSLFKIEKSKVFSIDTLLGFTLPFFMALGVLFLSFIKGYQPELISFLFGSILSVNQKNLLAIGFLTFLVLAFIFYFKNHLILTTFDKDQAKLSGVAVEKITLFYYIILSLTIIISIKTVGVILANALLVIPAATAKLVSRTLSQMFLITPLVSCFGVVSGLIISYFLNFPSGPSIVVFLGITFLLTFLFKKIA